MGSHSIYGIYTSKTFKVSAGGYLPFVIIPSDHCLLWIKIEFDSAFGAKMDTLVPHTARRLNWQKPDTIKLFIELYKNFIINDVLYLKLLYIQERLVYEPFTTPLQIKYDRLQKKSKMESSRQNKSSGNWRWGGPLEQAPAREHGYHPTLESRLIKKKKDQ